MITIENTNAPLPKPSVLFDPCFALDELGLWATARLQAVDTRELDLFLPARRTYRRIEIGHGEDAVVRLGHAYRPRLLVAMDKALARPLRLVIDPRRSDGGETILDDDQRPRESSFKALAAIVNAASYTVSGFAVEFAVPKPQRDRLALAAASLFGPGMGALFGHTVPTAQPPIGMVRTAPSAGSGRVGSGASTRVARYVRTATLKASGHNALDAQNKRINDYLAGLGLRSTHSLVDEGCNGMAAGRTGIEGLLRLAERGEIDAVVATSVDRFFRSATQFDRLLAQLRSMGVSVMLVDHASTLGLDFGFQRRRRI